MTRLYRNYVLVLLMVVYVFNFIDRQILVILQESIKTDLGLSDSQLGLLSGTAFAVFYVFCGIPIARWADRYNRVNIVSAAVVVWSGMTALCGFAGSYLQLFLARLGVGVGEAGASPPSHSIISDYFPHEQRGRAMSVYSAGVYIGILIGFLAGGWIGQYFGWRIAFLVVGLPGVLLGILVKLTLREPKRGGLDKAEVPDDAERSLLIDVAKLWKLKSFRYAALGSAMNAFLGYGSLNFFPSFAVRIYELPLSVVGTWIALSAGIGGGCGVLLSGVLSDKLGRRDCRWPYWVCAWSTLAAGVLIVPTLLTGNQHVMWVLFLCVVTFQSMFLAPTVAMGQALVAPSYRAFASAMIYFVLNIIGLGLGPLAVGAVSDALAPSMGVESIRWAIMITSIAGLTGSALYFLAAKFVREDLQQQAGT
jgi:MFS family permease